MRTASEWGRQWSEYLLVFMLLASIGLVICARLFASEPLWHVAWAAVGGTILVATPKLRLRETYLLSLCLVVALYIWRRHPEFAEILTSAMDQAGFLMVFILLLAMLREAAVTSPSVAELGAFMTRQKPGRRFAALFAGTSFMAVIFNVGVVSFLSPLIQRGIARSNAQDGLNHLREQRQISAMLRGFAWSVVWSPTAIAPLAVMELMPGIDRSKWIGMGFVIFLCVMAIGWAEDKWRFRAFRPAGAIVPLPLPGSAVFHFFAACAWLLGLSVVISSLSGDTVVFGLMVACPLMLVGWLAVQNGFTPIGVSQTRVRLREVLLENMPQNGTIAVTLACSGFLGRAGAGIVPGDELVSGLGLYMMPDWLLLGLIPVSLIVFSLLAFSPIMMAIFFGSLFGGLEVMPADPTMIALAISCGWALSMTFSPFATVVLLIQRVSGIPSRKLTFSWNLAFTTAAALFLLLFFAAIYA